MLCQNLENLVRVELLLSAQSTACTGCEATDCAARPFSAPQTCCFVTTRFASSRCFATRPLRGLGASHQLGTRFYQARVEGVDQIMFASNRKTEDIEENAKN